IWMSAQPLPDTAGLKTLRTGVEVGTLKKGRLEPAHALSHALAPADFGRRLELAADSLEVERYLKGETLSCGVGNGWTAVCVDGYGLGWGKAVNGVLKNHYPKGLRWK
ncbi:MAG: RsmF rRNA methyltransferase first C-terminal domain-containing protein, partial [Butyricicoccus sp.]|nr:RsmF rRNA methyltransferase first C-terminal domain-containing protein [Butyricicoccus sp.]